MKLCNLFFCTIVVSGMLFLYGSQAQAQGDALFAVLVGGNEVSAAGVANQGDLDGFGTATANILPVPVGVATGIICVGITVRGIDTPNAAHIHQNRAGLNGAIVVPLTAPTAGNPGTSSGCVSGVAVAILNQLRTNTANFYVNVHTALFPGGALRGQLF